MSQTPHEAALADVLPLIEALELPYLESLQQLLADHIVRRREEAVAEARVKIMKIALNLGMSLEDVMAAKPPRAPVDRKPSVPRYRDPASGKTWSGFGTIPGWIRGKDRSQFLIGDGA